MIAYCTEWTLAIPLIIPFISVFGLWARPRPSGPPRHARQPIARGTSVATDTTIAVRRARGTVRIA